MGLHSRCRLDGILECENLKRSNLDISVGCRISPLYPTLANLSTCTALGNALVSAHQPKIMSTTGRTSDEPCEITQYLSLFSFSLSAMLDQIRSLLYDLYWLSPICRWPSCRIALLGHDPLLVECSFTSQSSVNIYGSNGDRLNSASHVLCLRPSPPFFPE